MFSNINHLRARTPINGTDRESYLTLLVDEYVNTTSYDAKCQVIANLANFAYDPINYGFIRNVGVLDIFLHILKHESNEQLIQYSSAGICNLCLDPANAEYILEHDGLQSIIHLVKSTNNDTVLNAITTLLFLYNEKTKFEINNPAIVAKIKSFENCEDKRLLNISKVFLKDVCDCD